MDANSRLLFLFPDLEMSHQKKKLSRLLTLTPTNFARLAGCEQPNKRPEPGGAKAVSQRSGACGAGGRSLPWPRKRRYGHATTGVN
jgi:hypothetical protein